MVRPVDGAVGGAGRGRSHRPRRRVWLVSPEGFRELRRACFLDRKACAAFLGVCVRTIRHWDSGRNRVPWAAVKLLRLLRLGDLGALHPAWHGWLLRRDGDLVSPNGYRFAPWRLEAWPLVCEQARLWRDDDARRGRGVGAEPLRGRFIGETSDAAALPDASACALHPPRPGDRFTVDSTHGSLPDALAARRRRRRRPASVSAATRRIVAVRSPVRWWASDRATLATCGRRLSLRGGVSVSCEAACRGDSLPLAATPRAALCRSVPTFNKGLRKL